MNIPFKTEEEFNEFYNKKVESGNWISNIIKELTGWWGDNYLVYQWKSEHGKISITYKTRSNCSFIDNGRFAFPAECFWAENWIEVYKIAEEEEKKIEVKEREEEAKRSSARVREKELEYLKRLVAKFPEEVADLIDGP